MCIIYKQIHNVGHDMHTLLMGYIVQKMRPSEECIDRNFEIIVINIT